MEEPGVKINLKAQWPSPRSASLPALAILVVISQIFKYSNSALFFD
jgi:hypothetical protein